MIKRETPQGSWLQIWYAEKDVMGEMKEVEGGTGEPCRTDCSGEEDWKEDWSGDQPEEVGLVMRGAGEAMEDQGPI